MSGFALVHSRALLGLQAAAVQVEVHLANGLPNFTLVGLADTEVKEARERVRSAIANAGLEFPHNKRITVNLAPADLPKDSGRFDLPIALGILAASGQVDAARLNGYEFAGELSLSGELRPIRGALAMALAAVSMADQAESAASKPQAIPRLVLPEASAQEAALVPDAHVYAVRHLLDVVAQFAPAPKPDLLEKTPVTSVDTAQAATELIAIDVLAGAQAAPATQACANQPSAEMASAADLPQPDPAAWVRVVARPMTVCRQYPDLSEVKGQSAPKRALEIAAAGGHSILMVGPPGAGKSMLAQRFAGLLPPMNTKQALESAAVLSLAGRFKPEFWAQRVTQNPHHTASAVALVGGGSPPRPGEISLAHEGVLFLDELPEFPRAALEALREPLENGTISIARAARRAEFPARFQLIAAMNPCPCGYLGSRLKACRCSPDQVLRYQGKLSGPLLDRIDLHVEVNALPSDELLQASVGESSEKVAVRVQAARLRSTERQGKSNQCLQGQEIDAYCLLDDATRKFLNTAATRLGWSGRSTHRALKVARTIADLVGARTVQLTHIAEAIQYRRALKSV